MPFLTNLMRWRPALSGAALLVLCASVCADKAVLAENETYEVVIANGRVMDPESGLDAARSLGISGGKIRVVTAGALKGKQTFDARGLAVAPGFIDLHQHGQDAENYAAKAADGVTTALELEVGVVDVDQWYEEREGKARINYGASVGHIPGRKSSMNDPGGLLPSGGGATGRGAQA